MEVHKRGPQCEGERLLFIEKSDGGGVWRRGNKAVEIRWCVLSRSKRMALAWRRRRGRRRRRRREVGRVTTTDPWIWEKWRGLKVQVSASFEFGRSGDNAMKVNETSIVA